MNQVARKGWINGSPSAAPRRRNKLTNIKGERDGSSYISLDMVWRRSAFWRWNEYLHWILKRCEAPKSDTTRLVCPVHPPRKRTLLYRYKKNAWRLNNNVGRLCPCWNKWKAGWSSIGPLLTLTRPLVPLTNDVDNAPIKTFFEL